MTVVYQGKYSHCMRIGVAVPLNSTVSRLREAVARETKIPPDQVFIQKPVDSILCRLAGFSSRFFFAPTKIGQTELLN